MFGEEVQYFMEKINSFIVTKIKRKDKNTVILTAKINDRVENFEITFLAIGVTFSTQLEFLLRANKVSLSKDLLQMLQDYKDGKTIHFPCNLFDQANQPELVAA